MMHENLIGTCVHMMNGFICSEGKHQNYPCPYRHDIYNCICSVKWTKEMVEQLNETGHISIITERR